MTTYSSVNLICPACRFIVKAEDQPVATMVGTTLQYSHNTGECPATWAKAMNDAGNGQQVVLGHDRKVA